MFMSQSRLGVGVLILATLLVGPRVFAQENYESLKAKIDRLEAELMKTRAERAADRAQIARLEGRLEEVESGATNDRSLETHINSLLQDEELPIGTGVGSFGEVAQTLTFYGEARARMLYSKNVVTLRDGFDDQGLYADGRFRLGMDFRFTENVRTVFEIQAVGRFNNNSVLETSTRIGSEIRDPLDDLKLYQGYLELADLFDGGENTFLRAGRQELVYGNQFLLGSDDFFAGLTHDSVRFDADLGEWQASLFYAVEADPRDFFAATINGLGPTISKDQEWMVGLYNTFTFEALDPVTIELYWVFFESRDDTVLGPATFGTNFLSERTLSQLIFGRFHTIGMRLWAGDEALREGFFESSESFWASVEVAVQTGTGGRNIRGVNTVGGLTPAVVAFQEEDYTAFAGEGFFSYRFDGEWRFTVHAGFRWTEGGESNEVGFSPLFVGTHGTWASRFGNMDIFPLSNSVLWKLGVTFWPEPDLQFGATVIGGYIDNNEYDFYDSHDYGYEVDIYANWQHSANVLFTANLSVFFPSDNLDADLIPVPGSPGLFIAPTYQFAGSDPAVLLYMQAQVTF